jgi:hypothetical protein
MVPLSFTPTKRTPGYPMGREVAKATAVFNQPRWSDIVFRSTKLFPVSARLASKSSLDIEIRSSSSFICVPLSEPPRVWCEEG